MPRYSRDDPNYVKYDVAGDLVPDETDTHDLGEITKQFRELFTAKKRIFYEDFRFITDTEFEINRWGVTDTGPGIITFVDAGIKLVTGAADNTGINYTTKRAFVDNAKSPHLYFRFYLNDRDDTLLRLGIKGATRSMYFGIDHDDATRRWRWEDSAGAHDTGIDSSTGWHNLDTIVNTLREADIYLDGSLLVPAASTSPLINEVSSIVFEILTRNASGAQTLWINEIEVKQLPFFQTPT